MNRENKNRHWLYWPFVFLILQVLFYLFFLGSRGYLAYKKLFEEKITLQDQIAYLENEKKSLLNRKNILKDDKTAKDKFQQELYLYAPKDNSEILKFKLGPKTFSKEDSDQYTLLDWQYMYLIVGGIMQILIVILFYYIDQKARNRLRV